MAFLKISIYTSYTCLGLSSKQVCMEVHLVKSIMSSSCLVKHFVWIFDRVTNKMKYLTFFFGLLSLENLFFSAF